MTPAARIRIRTADVAPLRRSTLTRASDVRSVLARNLLLLRSFSAPAIFRSGRLSLRSVVRWQMHGILRDGPTHVPGRGSPAARWSLELAEKVSNYLNICRIDKSSRLPRNAPSFVRCDCAFGKMPDRRPKMTPLFRKSRLATEIPEFPSNGQIAYPAANRCGDSSTRSRAVPVSPVTSPRSDFISCLASGIAIALPLQSLLRDLPSPQLSPPPPRLC